MRAMLFLTFVLIACGNGASHTVLQNPDSAQTTITGSCASIKEGACCKNIGEARCCQFTQNSGGYVSCQPGVIQCQTNGSWSACEPYASLVCESGALLEVLDGGFAVPDAGSSTSDAHADSDSQ